MDAGAESEGKSKTDVGKNSTGKDLEADLYSDCSYYWTDDSLSTSEDKSWKEGANPSNQNLSYSVIEFKTKESTKVDLGGKISETPQEINDVKDENGKGIGLRINLARYLEKCILLCCLFPQDYEFEKDTMVQLWVAEGIFEPESDILMEVLGAAIYDVMVQKMLILPSESQALLGQSKYRINAAFCQSLQQKPLQTAYYSRVSEFDLGITSRMTTHLALYFQHNNPVTFDLLKGFTHLRTLILLFEQGSLLQYVPRNLFLNLHQLKTLDLHCAHIYELPSSVGNLRSLRYLDLSETPIMSLPESTDCLSNLQTLKLMACYGICGLPKNITKLVNLRHFDFDFVGQLNIMPRGIGNLTSLQTLWSFVVGREDGCCIGELKHLNNLRGSLCLARLENVSSANEAKEAHLNEKKFLEKLELRWSDRKGDSNHYQKRILECLEPHPSLKELVISFYTGTYLPNWIRKSSLVNVVSITFYKCRNCVALPPMGELPSLKHLTIVDMAGLKVIDHHVCLEEGSQELCAFPALEKLILDTMPSLVEWTEVEDSDFPRLQELKIRYCPKLDSIPRLSHLNSLKYLEMSFCSELQNFPEDCLPASLELLVIRDCPKIKKLCHNPDSEDWSKVSHVASVFVDHEEVSSTKEVGG